MPTVSINYLAVVIAAIAGFLVGWAWYTAFGKVWQDMLGKGRKTASRPRCHSSSPPLVAC